MVQTKTELSTRRAQLVSGAKPKGNTDLFVCELIKTGLPEVRAPSHEKDFCCLKGPGRLFPPASGLYAKLRLLSPSCNFIFSTQT